MFTRREHKPLNRNYFNRGIWHQPSSPPTSSPDEATAYTPSATYASVLIDAGESVKAVAEYLGHADPGLTLRVYAHLFRSSDDRGRLAVDQVLGGQEPSVARPSADRRQQSARHQYKAV
ncbi:MAG: hypothetical protein M3R01_09265 [Actinomycetota bacterium]|nr:hypothetical protein [Actinomycetota bacterium]